MCQLYFLGQSIHSEQDVSYKQEDACLLQTNMSPVCLSIRLKCSPCLIFLVSEILSDWAILGIILRLIMIDKVFSDKIDEKLVLTPACPPT